MARTANAGGRPSPPPPARTLEVPKTVEALSASGDKMELLSEYARLQALHDGVKLELAEKKKQLVVFQVRMPGCGEVNPVSSLTSPDLHRMSIRKW